jgi:hypothetical protein
VIVVKRYEDWAKKLRARHGGDVTLDEVIEREHVSKRNLRRGDWDNHMLLWNFLAVEAAKKTLGVSTRQACKIIAGQSHRDRLGGFKVVERRYTLFKASCDAKYKEEDCTPFIEEYLAHRPRLKRYLRERRNASQTT